MLSPARSRALALVSSLALLGAAAPAQGKAPISGPRAGTPHLVPVAILPTDPVVMTPAGLSYADHEIHPTRDEMVFQSLGAIYVGQLDPVTGLFANGDGRDAFVDSVTPLTAARNGPEYGLDAAGDAIFYNKTNATGGIDVWRAAPIATGFQTTRLTFGLDRVNQLPSQNALSPTTFVLYARAEPGPPIGTIAWFDEASPAAENDITPVVPGFAGFRWARDTSLLTATVSAGPAAGQIVLVDASTGTSRVVTNDPGIKFDPFPWPAPEFGGQLAVATIVNGSDIAIYADLGGPLFTRVTTIPIPPSSSMAYAQSPEGFVAGGRSYVTLTLKDDPGDIYTSVSESEIWIYAIDPLAPLAYRCDDARPGKVRHEAEVYSGAHETFLYYNEILQNGAVRIVRCRTLLPPR
jgi:hypothetical protein